MSRPSHFTVCVTYLQVFKEEEVEHHPDKDVSKVEDNKWHSQDIASTQASKEPK